MIDHVSGSWGLDENMSMYRHMYEPPDGSKPQKLPTVNISIQNSIFSEALDTYHHAFGSTIGGYNSTFHHNLWACNTGRNPSVGMIYDFTLINNVIFNWQHRTVDGGDHRSFYTLINNYFKPGPVTDTDRPIGHRILKPESRRSREYNSDFGKAYVAGNVVEGNARVTKDNWDGGVQVEQQDGHDAAKILPKIRVDEPYPHAFVEIESAEDAYNTVLRNAGATLPKRDAVDERVIQMVRTGEVNYVEGKGIITDIEQVGGYPTYAGEPYADADQDGMSDAWETEHRLNPNEAGDATVDSNGDGYTHIEEFLYGLDPHATNVHWETPRTFVDMPLSAAQPGLKSTEFIFESAPFPACHASTIVETADGLLAAWFGGTHERHPDVGIWVAHRKKDGIWSEPMEVANGVVSASERYPCWNPVLFRPKNGLLMLFYKVGPTPRDWWGMVQTSTDDGQTWSTARRLPDGMLGPIKNKPVQLANGDILSASSSEHDGWRVHFERSTDGGLTWQSTGPINDGQQISAIQPSILIHDDQHLQALGRTKTHGIFEVWSNDAGKTWGPLKPLGLPNPNAGTDAVALADGRYLLVYNHNPNYKGRSPLNVAVSNDGKEWQAALVLENETGKEFSYPAVIQSADGLVHITYTWQRRRIKHVVVNPSELQPIAMSDGNWPDRPLMFDTTNEN